MVLSSYSATILPIDGKVASVCILFLRFLTHAQDCTHTPVYTTIQPTTTVIAWLTVFIDRGKRVYSFFSRVISKSVDDLIHDHLD